MRAVVCSASCACRRKTATLLLLTALGLTPAAVHGQDLTVVDRRVPGPVESIVVENPRGETEIQSWSEPDVRVLAVRPGSGTGSSLASDLTIERTVPNSLKIAVRGGWDDSQVNLRVFVPFNTRVSLGSDRAGRSALSRSDWSPAEPAWRAEAPVDAAGFAMTRPRSVAQTRAAGLDAPPAGEVDNDARLELNALLVSLDVRVSDATGQKFTTLTEKDFEIFENGRRQDLVHFMPITAPVNLVLLLDLSGSTKDKMDAMKQAALAFIDSLNAQHNIAVAAFTRRFLLVSSFTTDKGLLGQRVMDLKNRDSGTAYYDSLWTALELFDEVESGRRAIVVLTDGVDNTLSDPGEYSSKHDFEELLDRAVRSETTVFPIYFDTEYEVVVQRGLGSHEAYKTARRQLDQLARETGGTLFRADRVGDLENAYRRVADELHAIYSLAYESSNPKRDGTWRAIEVKVRRGDAIVRTRPGYYAR
jgi:VWFA-related protein